MHFSYFFILTVYERTVRSCFCVVQSYSYMYIIRICRRNTLCIILKLVIIDEKSNVSEKLTLICFTSRCNLFSKNSISKGFPKFVQVIEFFILCANKFLTRFWPKKPKGFLVFSRGIKWEHWPEMG